MPLFQPKPIVRSLALALTLVSAPLFAEDATSTASKVLKTVNKVNITQADVDAFVAEKKLPAQLTPQQQAAVVDELVARELLYQEAQKRNLEQDPKLQQQLKNLQRELMVATMIQTALAENPVSEEALAKAYDEAAPGMAKSEFKARHILVETEEAAKDLISQLDKGADFAELAKEHSTGPSGSRGGDLGWFPGEQMVPPFTAGLKALENGQYSKAPVKTQFGWHVILREENRDTPAPALAEVRDKLEMHLRQQKLVEFIGTLREKAGL